MTLSKKTTLFISAIVAVAALLGLLYARSSVAVAQTQTQTQASSRVDALYSSMSKKERIAQLFMVQARSWKGQGAVTVMDQDLEGIYADYHFGAFIAFGANMQNTLETLSLSRDMQKAVTSTGGVPMIIATEQEGGAAQRIGTGTPMPGSMAVVATGDSASARASGRVISEELDALGYNCSLAPVLDINSNPDNPVLATRSFSDSPDLAAEYGIAFLEGLKAKDTIGCVKHFADYGDAGVDSRTGCPLVAKTWEELLDFELAPFQRAITQGADMIMATHIIYPEVDSGKIVATKGDYAGKEVGTPATLSRVLLTEKLRGELGFDGVICTDSMEMAGVASILEASDRAARAINAGADLICMPLADDDMDTPESFRRNMDDLIAYIEKEVPAERIEDAAKRILTLKEKRGILDYDASEYPDGRALETVGCGEFRQEERDMAAAGVTLVKNVDDALPLKPPTDSKFLMLVQDCNEGYREQYAAQLILGWNRAREAGLIPEGASVDVVMFDKDDWDDASKLAAIDAADYIFTNSIARDKSAMAYKAWQTAAPKKYTDYARERGKKSFVISIDMPYDVQLFPSADGVLAVYNPTGSKENWQNALRNGTTVSRYAMGANLVAAVEVAFGLYGASGVLPVNIYAFDTASDSFDMNDIVYGRGFGLSYDPITNMDKVSISLEFTQAEYTGKEIRPQVIAQVEAKRTGAWKTLTEGKDYSVQYLNNVEVGTATVELSGLGSYSGSASANFLIVDHIPATSDQDNTEEENESAGIGKTGDSFFPVACLLLTCAISLGLLFAGRKKLQDHPRRRP